MPRRNVHSPQKSSEKTVPICPLSPDLRADLSSSSDAIIAKEQLENKSRYSKFLERGITGIAMIIFFTALVYSDHSSIAFFVLFLQVKVYKELMDVRYNFVKERNLHWFRTLNWVLLSATFFFLYGKTLLQHAPSAFLNSLAKYHIMMSFVAYTAGFVLFVLTLVPGYYKVQISQLSWTIMTLVFAVMPSSAIIKNTYEGIIWFMIPATIVICNDCFAYFCGFFAGKKFIHRPFLTISPNKTWEGFIGATFWTLAFAYVASGYFSQYEWLICPRETFSPFSPVSCTPNPVFLSQRYYIKEYLPNILAENFSDSFFEARPVQLHSLVLALFGSLIAPFGGFFASAIKRAYKIKDFSNVFPGHGGFTDRTDCQYIMSLFAFVYYTCYIKLNTIGTNELLSFASSMSLEQKQEIIQRLTESL